MKLYIILFLALVSCANVFGQNSFDLEEIKKATVDTASNPNYKSLVAEFNQSPSSLNVSHGTIIYYGKLFTQGYKPYNLNLDEIEFTKLLSKKKYHQAITKGEEIITTDPANLEILAKLMICYHKVGLTEKADLTKAKVDLLVASILANGSGKSKDNTLKVISIGDEYAVMGILGISGLSRSSVMTGPSTFDTWKAKDQNGKRIDFFIELLINLQTFSKSDK